MRMMRHPVDRLMEQLMIKAMFEPWEETRDKGMKSKGFLQQLID